MKKINLYKENYSRLKNGEIVITTAFLGARKGQKLKVYHENDKKFVLAIIVDIDRFISFGMMRLQRN